MDDDIHGFHSKPLEDMHGTAVVHLPNMQGSNSCAAGAVVQKASCYTVAVVELGPMQECKNPSDKIEAALLATLGMAFCCRR